MIWLNNEMRNTLTGVDVLRFMVILVTKFHGLKFISKRKLFWIFIIGASMVERPHMWSRPAI